MLHNLINSQSNPNFHPDQFVKIKDERLLMYSEVLGDDMPKVKGVRGMLDYNRFSPPSTQWVILYFLPKGKNIILEVFEGDIELWADKS